MESFHNGDRDDRGDRWALSPPKRGVGGRQVLGLGPGDS